jgi:exonuclease III
MRIASWNLNHRARQRSIPAWVVPEILAAGPDVLVCTEYVEGRAHEGFLSDLKGAGFSAVSTTDVAPGQNQLLIASREHHQRGHLQPPRDIDKSVPSNALHVVIGDVNVLGFRMPAFGSAARHLKRCTWEWIRDVATELRDTPALIVGDMNTQRKDTRTYCGDCIEEVLSLGWSEVIPESGYSWQHRSGSGRRIDFGFASPALTPSSVQYSWDFVERRGVQRFVVGIPDHALLIADLTKSSPPRPAV